MNTALKFYYYIAHLREHVFENIFRITAEGDDRITADGDTRVTADSDL